MSAIGQGDYTHICYLNSNNNSGIIAIGMIDELTVTKGSGFDQLKTFYAQKNDWLFGYLSYDLKNETEALQSSNPDYVGLPLLHFFQPKYFPEVDCNVAKHHVFSIFTDTILSLCTRKEYWAPQHDRVHKAGMY